MDPPNKRLIQFNRLFVTLCSHWASINGELNYPANAMLALLDKLTIAWSLVIMCTNFLKFILIFTRPRASLGPLESTLTGAGLGAESESSANISLSNGEMMSELLLLNYVPIMNEFGKLYYGLMLVTVGSALVWRIYLHLRQRQVELENKQRKQQHHPMCSSSGRVLFDSKLELTSFFLSGPPSRPSAELKRSPPSLVEFTLEAAAIPKRQRGRALRTIGELISARRRADNLIGKYHKPALYPVSLPRQTNLLTRLHGATRRTSDNWAPVEPRRAGGPDGANGELDYEQQQQQQQQLDDSSLIQVYRVPIRSMDFLQDHSAARWEALAAHFYGFVAFGTIASLPLFYYVIEGLNAVRSLFRRRRAAHRWSWLLDLYGPIEQTYACVQASMFFLATNMFIALFHADLLYKCRPIVRELRILSHFYRQQQLNRLPSAEVYRQQLRIWAYFDTVLALDHFVSRYALISTATVIVGMSFAQSYLRIELHSLKSGTAAALLSNLLSFTFLHVISWHVEVSSAPVHKSILSILARESSHSAKREWQRTLMGFFSPDWPRTFTLGGRYAINLQSFLRTIFGLATISLVINRLFHKRAWEQLPAEARPGG